MMSEALPRASDSEVAHGLPRVLVGIVTHNRAGILPKAIESALSQSYPNIEVAVLDDGSDDGTSALQSDFPAVQWQRWESPRGYLEARNLLMRTARADYYLSLDDDAWFTDTDEIAVAIEYLEANPKVAGGAFNFLGPDRTPPPLAVPPPATAFVIRWVYHMRKHERPATRCCSHI